MIDNKKFWRLIENRHHENTKLTKQRVMQKQIFSLLSVLFLSTFCNAVAYAAQGQSYPTDLQENDSDSSSNREQFEIAQGDPNASSGRQDYYQGGPGKVANDYPEHHQTSPSTNPRWYKSREGRQEYLKGGPDYPRSMRYESSNQGRGSDQNYPSGNSQQSYNSRDGQAYQSGGTYYQRN